jgi:toxin-antitoxin system PIN domain toxin
MSTSSFLDANVWLTLIWDRHEHSARARAWFEHSAFDPTAGGRVLFCRFTQLTVLRLLTTSAVMGGDVQTMRGAWEVWDETAADERVGFLAEPEDLEPRFRKNSRLASSSPKVWVDAYLLAFTQACGLTLVTFDHALARRASDSLVIA